MQYPEIPEHLRLSRLMPPEHQVRMVLDTDTYNEIDDQFALVYALLSPDDMKLEAIYAAPFWNDKSSGPKDGMEKSYDEILRLLERMDVEPDGLVYKGSTGYLEAGVQPYDTPAARDLIQRALSSPEDDPLYVVAIGAITNVASAILLEPEIIRHIVIVWLGGNPLHWPDTLEFNLNQDVTAAQVVFDCGVPLVQVPCLGVSSHLLTTVPELEVNLKGKSAICDYLLETFCNYSEDHFAWSKEIWDISAIAWLINNHWLPSEVVHSPILNPNRTYSHDPRRHFIRVVRMIYRNPVFKDLFAKLNAHAENPGLTLSHSRKNPASI